MTFLTLGESLICFDSGENTLDSVTHVHKYVVGAESNVAIGLARLGHRVAYVGRVGRDTRGREIIRTLRGEGVDVSSIRTVDLAATGILLKETAAAGNIEVTYHRAASAGASLDVADLPDDFSQIRRLHVTGITLVLSDSARESVLEAMRRARAAGARVSLDANFRRKLASPPALVAAFETAVGLADEVILGRTEAALAAGSEDLAQIESYVRALPAQVRILKGARGGALAYLGASHERIEVEAEIVDVVDPVGSGDAFTVGFLDTLLDAPVDPHGLRRALRAGTHFSARVIGARGDYHGLPYAEDVRGSEGIRETALAGVTR